MCKLLLIYTAFQPTAIQKVNFLFSYTAVKKQINLNKNFANHR